MAFIVLWGDWMICCHQCAGGSSSTSPRTHPGWVGSVGERSERCLPAHQQAALCSAAAAAAHTCILTQASPAEVRGTSGEPNIQCTSLGLFISMHLLSMSSQLSNVSHSDCRRTLGKGGVCVPQWTNHIRLWKGKSMMSQPGYWKSGLKESTEG